jgi:hypothetical protein
VRGIADQRQRALTRTRSRMPKMRERRMHQVVVGQCREYTIGQVRPSGEMRPDHVDRTFRSDEVE